MRKTAFLLLAIFFSVLVIPSCERSPQEDEEVVMHATSYEIEAELHKEEKKVSVSTTIRYSIPADDLSAVKLRLYANVYQGKAVSDDMISAAYPSGVDHGGFEIKKISDDIEELTYQVGVEDPTVLTVRLSEKKKRGDVLTMTVQGVLSLAHIKHRIGYEDDHYILTEFYPRVCPFSDGKYRVDPYYTYGDPFLHETANYRVRLIYPVGTNAATSLFPVEHSLKGSNYVTLYEGTQMREFACVISSRFLCQKSESGKTPIRYYYTNDKKSADTLSYIEEALAVYEDAFGDYPYESLTVVQAPFFEAGMEYSGLALIDNSLSTAERKRTILHEIAHQWWHGKVGSDETIHPWQDEALAEYAVAYFYKHQCEEKNYKKMIDVATDEYTIYAAVKGDAAIDCPLSAGESGYKEITYAKGLLMLSTLAEIVGFDSVNRALKNYADANKNVIADPRSFLSAMTLIKDLPDRYFERWLYTPLPLA